jgi:type II secretory pathway component HofQ
MNDMTKTILIASLAFLGGVYAEKSTGGKISGFLTKIPLIGALFA